MQTLSKIWNNFKVQPDIWFFYGFLITFTLSIRKVLYFFPIRGQFNEYAGIYLYLSDIFLVLVLASWIISIINNKTSLLSIYRANKAYIVMPFLLVLWAFLSILWSENQVISLFRSIKLLEFFLLYFFIGCRFKNCSTWNNLFKIIIFVAVVQSIIAIFQFILQHSVGLFWLKEGIISPEILGVAKIIINNEVFVRSYGLFPHPNILGGFLVFSILVTVFYYDLFHVKQFFTAKQVWNKIILLIQIVALFLTFSKSAIVGLILGFIYLCAKSVPCGTIVVIIKRYLRIAVFGLLALLLFSFVIKLDFYSLFIKSLIERNLYIDVSRGTILHNPFFGSGMGQFVLHMQSYSSQLLQFWQFQPVHNVFLLIWSELGLVGLGLFLWFILKSFLKRANLYLKAVLIGFLFIMLFDHYLWDIQQGQILLWMTLGLAVASGTHIDKK